MRSTNSALIGSLLGIGLAILVIFGTVAAWSRLISAEDIPGTLRLAPVADAYVDRFAPDTNFGLDDRLKADAVYDDAGEEKIPSLISYLTFDLGDIDRVTMTTLDLYVINPSRSSSGVVTWIDDTEWQETSITFNSRPVIDGMALAEFAVIEGQTWVQFDITPAVVASLADGRSKISLAIVTRHRDAAWYASRESDDGDAPRLSILTIDDGIETPVPTVDPEPTPTEDSTPDPSPTEDATPDPIPTEDATPDPGPTEEATAEPTLSPTEEWTPEPTANPTEESTPEPTASPTEEPTEEPTAEPTTTPIGEEPVIVLAAGDIASCESDGDEATAAIVVDQPGLVLTLGDHAYQDGTAAQFRDCYDPTWGAFKSRTRPSPGNHDYHTSGASAYYAYFGAAAGDPSKGYYSFDLGNNWQGIALNSNCDSVGGCGILSPQYQWLAEELALHAGKNVLAYWHHARYSSGGEHGSDRVMDPIWDLLVTTGADVVLVGHEHNYERFAPIGIDDQRDDARGLRQFVVGTGGKSLYSMGRILPTSEAHNNDTDGVLRLALYPDRYAWEFLPEAGKTFTDTGSALVH